MCTLRTFLFLFSRKKTVASTVNLRRKSELTVTIRAKQGVNLIKETKTIFKTLENDVCVHIAYIACTLNLADMHIDQFFTSPGRPHCSRTLALMNHNCTQAIPRLRNWQNQLLLW